MSQTNSELTSLYITLQEHKTSQNTLWKSERNQVVPGERLSFYHYQVLHERELYLRNMYHKEG